jgi:hypothetical protein
MFKLWLLFSGLTLFCISFYCGFLSENPAYKNQIQDLVVSASISFLFGIFFLILAKITDIDE